MIAEGVLVDTSQAELDQQQHQQQMQQQSPMQQQTAMQQQPAMQQQTAMQQPPMTSGPMQSGPMQSGPMHDPSMHTNGSTRKPSRMNSGDGCCDNARERAKDAVAKVAPCASDESDNGVGLCGWLLTTISWGLVMVTLPFSLCVCFKVVQEYERAVIFRLGRLLKGGSRGPG